MKPSIRKRLAAGIAGLALAAGSIMLAPSAHATGDPNQLDQGDFTLQCRHQFGTWGWQAGLYGSTVVDWKCVDYFGLGTAREPIDVNNYCWRMFGNGAHWHNYSDPYSWYCG